MELFIKHSQLSLHSEVVDAVCGHHLIQFPQIVCFRYVAKCSVTPLCHVQILLFRCQRGQHLPVGFSLRGQLERFQYFYSVFKTLILQSSTEFDEPFIEIV